MTISGFNLLTDFDDPGFRKLKFFEQHILPYKIMELLRQRIQLLLGSRYFLMNYLHILVNHTDLVGDPQ
ncbi:hypothetical protein D3C87_1791140 [compost metagenome]